MSRLVLATDDAAFEERVRHAFDGEFNGDLRYWRDGILRGDPSRAASELIGGGAEVVALGPGLPDQSALELARALDHDHPEIGVVLVADPSPGLLRSALQAGARDVIAPDVPGPELRAALELALGAANERRRVLDRRVAEPDTATTRVITVLCPKGGAGKTTLATNLAVGLADRTLGRVVIVDLDLQFGDVASALHLTPEHTVTDAVDAPKLDATTLKVFLTPHRREFFALCAPSSPIEADAIEASDVQRILDMLVESFDYVVIDTASGLDEAALAAIEVSTDLVLLSAPDVPCVHGTRKEIEALQLIGHPTQEWHVVLNRADARTGLDAGDIEATIGVPIDLSIPESRAIPVALNQGCSILESEPRSGPAKAFGALVDRIAPPPPISTDGGRAAGSRFRRSK